MSTINVTLSELRPKIPGLIKRVSKYFDRCIVTRHGKPEAVIMAEDDYESLLETLEILSDSKLVKEIRKAQEELKAGKRISWEKAKGKLGYV